MVMRVVRCRYMRMLMRFSHAFRLRMLGRVVRSLNFVCGEQVSGKRKKREEEDEPNEAFSCASFSR
jgi:hypothetical protein